MGLRNAIMGFWHQPQRTLLRRALFQVHLWVGIAAGLYLLLMSVTGVALLFRIDMQRALDPALFPARTDAALVAPGVVLQNLERAYPTWRIAGVAAPTDRRPSYLAYVVDGNDFLSVLLDPGDGHVLGTLPERSFIHTLQRLHFDLLGGATGRRINGIGALLLLVLALSGPVIWWRGRERWRRGLAVRLAAPAAAASHDLHSAAGFWAWPLLAMWAVTGLYFSFPQAFRASVAALSPLSAPVRPSSRPPAAGAAPLPHGVLISRAAAQAPGLAVAQVVPAPSPTGAYHVQFARHSPTRVGEALRSVYLDQYSGEPLPQVATPHSAGDIVMQAAGPLHTGGMGGWPLRLAWVLFGLAPALLFITGFTCWWKRRISTKIAVCAQAQGKDPDDS